MHRDRTAPCYGRDTRCRCTWTTTTTRNPAVALMVLSGQPGARDSDRGVPPCPGGDRVAAAVLAGGQHPLRHGLPVTPEHALGDVPVVEDPAERQHAGQNSDDGERPGRCAIERI